jgi:hypothetical protein
MLSTKLKEAAGNSADATLYVDDVFSTWLYTGNSSTQTITNGIDLAGNGGLVWLKPRSAAVGHALFDSNRGTNNYIASETTNAQSVVSGPTFTSTGFNLNGSWNGASTTYASWTFRKAAKFFDVVTYTGTGSARTIAHSLGIAPGMVFVKRTDVSANWQVYSNGMTSAAYSMQLNLTNAQASAPTVWNSTAPTSSVFSVGTDSTVNASGGTYVAYLYAHDTSSTGFIQCGSYAGTGNDSTGAVINLGWEPQYVMIKRSGPSGTNANWMVLDTMRGLPVGGAEQNFLRPNLSNEEANYGIPLIDISATGFTVRSSTAEINAGASTYIYMAIRRPNKPPTTGTQVYTNAIQTTGITPTTSTTGFVTDLIIQSQSPSATNKFWSDRLRGTTSNNYAYVISNSTSVEATGTGGGIGLDNNTGFSNNLIGMNPTYNWNFKRAPGFFDVVCYTGTSSTVVVTNNLTVAPELIITKNRSSTADWAVCYGFTTTNMGFMFLNSGGAASYDTYANLGVLNSKPTSTSYSLTAGSGLFINNPGSNFVAYLFATLAGISKVGSYTGNGTGQAIACGFGSAGARFVLIKRTDSTGGWYTYDSARGLTSGSSPYLLLNSTAAEVTGNNGVYASSGGFTLGATASTTTNISGASYIFLAVA